MTRIHHYYVQRARNLCLFYARTGTASLHLGALIRFIKFYDAYRGIKYFKYAAVVLSLGLLVIRRCGFPADIVISFYPNAFVVLVYPTEEDHCLDLFKVARRQNAPCVSFFREEHRSLEIFSDAREGGCKEAGNVFDFAEENMPPKRNKPMAV